MRAILLPGPGESNQGLGLEGGLLDLLENSTGITMWFRMYKERKIGAILLAISLGYSLTLILLIRAV